MRYLVDTNVISEAIKPRPDTRVETWLRNQPSLDLALSALTYGEIRKGILLLADGRRKQLLERWLATELPLQFAGRVLPVGEPIALEWGRLLVEGRRKGRELPPIDGLLIATASVHGLILVTRNERDCANRGVPILNPWSL